MTGISGVGRRTPCRSSTSPGENLSRSMREKLVYPARRPRRPRGSAALIANDYVVGTAAARLHLIRHHGELRSFRSRSDIGPASRARPLLAIYWIERVARRKRRRPSTTGRANLPCPVFQTAPCSPTARALEARPAGQLLSGRKIPTANHAPPAALRIRSMGLAQLADGGAESLSLILKSPVSGSSTPARFVESSVKGAAASQIR